MQHAHQHGIIHRDIKPGNIRVTMQDGKPLPKVIDFGIAKAMAGELMHRTVFTEQGQLIGTPEYMSPEQAQMSDLGIDTTTDIYSLGVLLYELLTGYRRQSGRPQRTGHRRQWYFKKHDLKWTTDIGYGFNEVGSFWSSSGAGWRTDGPDSDGQLVVRSQLQLLF